MSKIHYFQRFDSKENWVTNATLLLLSRLHNYNRLKFSSAINIILTESNLQLDIGVNFAQQKRGESSVVDGVILQDSFKVVIETKLYDNFSTEQLKRHLDALAGSYSQKILLALSKNMVSDSIRKEVIKELQKSKYRGIQFASTTYEDIYQAISGSLNDFDTEMKEVLDDYISLCEDHGLTNLENRTMLAFTAGESFAENLRYRIYYDPAIRNHNSPFKYIGLYKNKSIVAVGEKTKVVSCDLVDGQLVATNNDKTLFTLDPEEYNRIKETIENTPYYDLQKGSKFFLVDQFYLTNYRKTSFSSVRAKRYFSLDDIEGFKVGMTAQKLAGLLEGKTWE